MGTLSKPRANMCETSDTLRWRCWRRDTGRRRQARSWWRLPSTWPRNKHRRAACVPPSGDLSVCLPVPARHKSLTPGLRQSTGSRFMHTWCQGHAGSSRWSRQTIGASVNLFRNFNLVSGLGKWKSWSRLCFSTGCCTCAQMNIKGFLRDFYSFSEHFFFLVCVFVRPSLGHSNIEPTDMFEVTNINFSEVMIRCQS